LPPAYRLDELLLLLDELDELCPELEEADELLLDEFTLLDELDELFTLLLLEFEEADDAELEDELECPDELDELECPDDELEDDELEELDDECPDDSLDALLVTELDELDLSSIDRICRRSAERGPGNCNSPV
jgi:hypothetical protein